MTFYDWPGPIAGVWMLATSCGSAPAATTAVDVARIACNAVAEARAAELDVPKAEMIQKLCETRDAIAPWVEAAQHSDAVAEAGVVVSAGDAGE